LIPNPIHKVLLTFQNYGVRALLMGGQACVFYGAAEFSRDTDFAIHADPANLERLAAAMRELQAVVIAVPPYLLEHLLKGHAVHFRCHHPEAIGLRVDIMSRMRGVADFSELWERRTTLKGEDGVIYELLSLADLIQAKKTQRDKDWPMIRRLVEADRAACTGLPSPEQVRLWLQEGRTPELLLGLAREYAELAKTLIPGRPAVLKAALLADESEVETALAEEERAERAADRTYWAPLKQELERLRHASFSTRIG
jgi:hypothetical protein